ncbi:MAG: family 1 encapsulin nanocompartment shell protein [Anaerolineae bacterium]
MDFLMRDDAPLTEQEWQALDDAVVRTARAGLVGRRFIRIYGPLGAGVQAVFVDRLSSVVPGVLDTYGEADAAQIAPSGRQVIPLPLLYKDFRLFWRDAAAARAQGSPIDVAPTAAAAAMLARAEDNLIFVGDGGQPGLMTVEGHLTEARVNGWAKAGDALATVARARQALVAHGAMGPYALALSPDLYALLWRVHGQMGRLELELVQQVADAGVFQTPALGEGQGVLVSSGLDVLDLAVADDMRVAFLGPSNMNLMFRVFESVALRIRRPEGICVLG